MRTVRGCIRAADDTAAEHVTVGVRPQIGLTPRGTHSRGGLDLARDPRAYLEHGERRLEQGLQVDPGPRVTADIAAEAPRARGLDRAFSVKNADDASNSPTPRAAHPSRARPRAHR